MPNGLQHTPFGINLKQHISASEAYTGCLSSDSALHQKCLDKFQALAFGKISASLQKLISLISGPTDSLVLPQSLAPAENGYCSRSLKHRLRPGKVLNIEAGKQALRNINGLGLFSNIEVNPRPDEKNEGGIIVEIKLEELEQKTAEGSRGRCWSYSVRGYNMGEIGAARNIVELAAELRIPVKGTHVYAFAEHGNDLGSSKDVKGNPTEVYRRLGHGSSYGAGVKLGLV
ncbi:hypothetical protein FH972_011544 [Carpinus fangiana]|uniref:Uncharacterized protein n=1 Tax=Carpinus fangiana TaxID=176857 RepID=A0A660KRS4_9ROSI|nr:hypothetical protein FH972_011544 [Carpinus fangiana]